MNVIELWVWSHFLTFLCVFGTALYLNFNFNTILVGTIYLIPLVPLGIPEEQAIRYMIVTFQNMAFGTLELVVFVLTVRPEDATFKRDHIQQLFGHTLPIAVALIGLSLYSRGQSLPVSMAELLWIAGIFFAGCVLRAVAIWQIGQKGFKFDIVFREEQSIKTNQLYGLMRHPSYTGMMIVILAYSLNTHDWLIASLGLVCAWFGFQYRIHHEEAALAEHFGEDYKNYKKRTWMWFPLPFR